ncbi:Bone marrow proteoglycan [Holothuria leucospilota]|uniref:Bone marrow proteoglycan n=1 Tax=Holothuria leucospilota TaxID=206669 RepID=A0A9Q1HE68_HOLLE|nr:Bone marrow proteoglycan [Holothuria leucospilota]
MKRFLSQDFFLLVILCDVWLASLGGASMDCATDETAYASSCYFVGNTSLSQSAARAVCIERGMDLVTIDYEEENEFIQNEIPAEADAWTGLASGLYGGGGGGFSSSSDVWQSFQVLSAGTPYQEFSVETGGSDARVALAEDIGGGKRYEIALGAKNGTKVTISRCNGIQPCRVKKRRIIRKGLFGTPRRERDFSVKCWSGRILIQTIDKNGAKLNMTFRDDSPIPCNYIGFASGSGSFISWGYWHRFAWASGDSVKYLNWGRNAPKETHGDRCVTIAEKLGSWNGEPCNRRHPFICESYLQEEDTYYEKWSSSFVPSSSYFDFYDWIG